jgi:hypothetical protein
MASIPIVITGTLTYSELEATHPIAPGGAPPVAGWTPPSYHPSHPIAPGGAPPVATPPIFYPPEISGPPGPWPAPPIAPGGSPPTATPPIFYPPQISHPIVLPPEQPPTEPPGSGTPGGSWSYSPNIGWYWTSPGGRWLYIAGDKPAPPQVPPVPPPAT